MAVQIADDTDFIRTLLKPVFDDVPPFIRHENIFLFNSSTKESY
jgi:hypothetical protein